jgi:Uma2 family endonuclease
MLEMTGETRVGKTMVQSVKPITDEELILLSSKNPELQFERNADGTLVTMPPTGKISSNREIKAGAYLFNWVESQNLGEVFSSSGGFKLANGAVRSPDAAFVAKERLRQGWDEGEDEFFNLAPDFVIEIRSKTDNLEVLQAKMQEYIANGVRLGWLIDRHNRQALVYRADGSITQYPATATLEGEDVVPGFTLALQKLL